MSERKLPLICLKNDDARHATHVILKQVCAMLELSADVERRVQHDRTSDAEEALLAAMDEVKAWLKPLQSVDI